MLHYVDSMMIVDKNQNIIYTNRLNPRFGGGLDNEYNGYIGKRYLEVYPDILAEDSTMIQCLKTGQVIVREGQTFTDIFGRVYTTNNITYPIIRYGEVVAAMELSQDITSVGDLKNMERPNKPQSNAVNKDTHANSLTSMNCIITNNNEMLENVRKIKLFASNNEPVLIYGETGTGKELFMEAIVNESKDRRSKFIAQNCAAIPENLFESILFGSSKGAFTGAENKIGLFEMADKGILFLDELNSMPLQLQAKLLRVIQDGKIRAVGGTVEKSVDVKVIVAMNKNPMLLIKDNLLREDLFYRLSGSMLYLSPLRERKEDIPLYLEYFTEHFNNKYGKTIYSLTPSLKSVLLKYWWPGNVRELRHVLESMISMSETNELSSKNIPIYMKELMDSNQTVSTLNNSIELPKMPLKDLLENFEREHITNVLIHCSGNVTKAAKTLQIPRQTLKFRMDKLGITRISDNIANILSQM
jgi:arginine utilization regulatory protein